MAKTATSTVSYLVVGDGEGSQPSGQQDVTTAAPEKFGFTLAAGNNTIQMPAGFSYAAVIMRPPAGSANAKTVKGVTGDTGLAGWTSGWVRVPAVPGGSIVVNSAGVETITLEPG